MQRPQLLDVVQLKAATPAYDEVDGETEIVLGEGATGTIVEVFTTPDEAYLVEFVNEQGETISMLTLRADQFEVVWRANLAVAQQAGT